MLPNLSRINWLSTVTDVMWIKCHQVSVGKVCLHCINTRSQSLSLITVSVSLKVACKL